MNAESVEDDELYETSIENVKEKEKNNEEKEKQIEQIKSLENGKKRPFRYNLSCSDPLTETQNLWSSWYAKWTCRLAASLREVANPIARNEHE